MPDKKEGTKTLMRKLLETTSISRFIRRLDGDYALPPFCEYINRLCAEKGVTAESVIKKTDIERTYGHKLFNGTRTPSRDTVLQLAFGFEMDYEQAQKLLSAARKSPLHPRVKRDAAVVFVLKEGLGISEIQSILSDLELPILGKERSYG